MWGYSSSNIKETRKFEDIIKLCRKKDYIVEYFHKKNLLPIQPEMECYYCCGTARLELDRDSKTGDYEFNSYHCRERYTKKGGCSDSQAFELFEELDIAYMEKDKFNWFLSSKFPMPIEKILKVIYWLINKVTRDRVALECGTTEQYVVDLEKYVNKVLNQWLIENSRKIGGDGRIVEIFEHKDNNDLKGEFVIGIEKNSENYFTVPMENFDADSLVAVINEWILPDTTVKSNLWEKLQCLKTPGFEKLEEKNLMKFEGQKKEKVSSSFNAYDVFKKSTAEKSNFDMFWDVVGKLEIPILELSATVIDMNVNDEDTDDMNANDEDTDDTDDNEDDEEM